MVEDPAGRVWVSFVICCHQSSEVGIGNLRHLLSSIQGEDEGEGIGKIRHLLSSI